MAPRNSVNSPLEKLSIEMKTMLLDATIRGDLRAFKRAAYKLAKDEELEAAIASACDKNGNGPLHYASAGGHYAICRYLIDDLKFDPNLSPPTGKTPIMHAAGNGRVGTINYLIGKGANLDTRAADGFTAVHNAILDGHHKALRVLLSNGGHADAEHLTAAPLLLAAYFGDVPCMKILLDYNANPNIFCELISPLVVSVSKDSMECVEVLTKAGADVNKIPLLEWAIDSKEMMVYLLNNGANPNLTNELGRSPLEIAAAKGKKEIVNILFPLTSPIIAGPEWSIHVLLSHVESEDYKKEWQALSKRRIESLKNEIKHALNRRGYFGASILSDFALKEDPTDVIAKTIQSLCWKRISSALIATGCITNDDKPFPFTDDEYEKALFSLIEGKLSEPTLQKIMATRGQLTA